MKKVIVIISCCFFFILAGCAQNENNIEELKTANVHAFFEQAREYSKKPLLWKVRLVDDRTGEEEWLTLNDYGYFQSPSGLNEQLIAQFASELARAIDTPMRNPTFDESGNIIPGHNRVILAEEEFVKKIIELDDKKEEILLPIYETVPTVQEEDLAGIMDEVIGSYTTYFNPNVTGRATNIKVSSEAIQHYVLGPGDVFSFNQVVGERTKERGYQEALEIVNNEFVNGIGGGICQTSSTLFNAVDEAGLEIIERHTHSREISYVPRNRDATVSWGGPDFVFSNSLPVPILLKTYVSFESGEMKVEVYRKKM